MPATAHVSVNGSSQTVSAGVSFPRSNPLFRIAAVGKTYVKIGLVKGHFLDGKATEKLIVGKSITLVSQPDGTPYTIALVSIG
jgi:hypothetical protein